MIIEADQAAQLAQMQLLSGLGNFGELGEGEGGQGSRESLLADHNLDGAEMTGGLFHSGLGQK